MTRSRFSGGSVTPRKSDPRYHTARWKRTAREVIVEPGYFMCYREGCYNAATCADHIDPVHPGMPDFEFFDKSRLRPACRKCNISRGFAAVIGAVETDEPVTPRPVSRGTIFDRPRPRIG